MHRLRFCALPVRSRSQWRMILPKLLTNVGELPRPRPDGFLSDAAIRPFNMHVMQRSLPPRMFVLCAWLQSPAALPFRSLSALCNLTHTQSCYTTARKAWFLPQWQNNTLRLILLGSAQDKLSPMHVKSECHVYHNNFMGCTTDSTCQAKYIRSSYVLILQVI